MMQMATPQIIGTIGDTASLCTIMGAGGMEPVLPVQIVSTGLPDIIFPVPDIAALDALAPDMQALSAMSAELNVVGVHAFALSNDGYTAHVRNFAPLYDIPEESATGTANAALTYYLYNNGLLQSGAQCAFMQGEAMKRPSVVSTELKDDCSVYVGGNSYILTKGEMFL